MFLNHKIFITLSLTIPQSRRTMASNALSVQVTVYYNTFLLFLFENKKWYCLHGHSFSNFPAASLFPFGQMNLGTKDDLRGETFFCFFVFFWWDRSHDRHWQALREFATISAEDLAWSHRALGTVQRHFSCFVLQSRHAKEKKIVILESYEILHRDLLHRTATPAPGMLSEFKPKSTLGQWSENSFSALKALFRRTLWVNRGAGSLWEMFRAANGWGRGGTQSTAALEVKILVSTLSGTANDMLSHHLTAQREAGEKKWEKSCMWLFWPNIERLKLLYFFMNECNFICITPLGYQTASQTKRKIKIIQITNKN